MALAVALPAITQPNCQLRQRWGTYHSSGPAWDADFSRPGQVVAECSTQLAYFGVTLVDAPMYCSRRRVRNAAARIHVIAALAPRYRSPEIGQSSIGPALDGLPRHSNGIGYRQRTDKKRPTTFVVACLFFTRLHGVMTTARRSCSKNGCPIYPADRQVSSRRPSGRVRHTNGAHPVRLQRIVSIET